MFCVGTENAWGGLMSNGLSRSEARKVIKIANTTDKVNENQVEPIQCGAYIHIT